MTSGFKTTKGQVTIVDASMPSDKSKPLENTPDSQGDSLLGKNYLTLFNFIVGIVRNLGLLLAVPVIVAVLAYFSSSFIPATYTSTAYLAMNEMLARSAEDLLRSPLVLSPVVEKFGVPGLSADQNRAQLNSRLSLLSSGERRTASLFTLSLEGSAPARTQEILTMIVETWLEKSRPRDVSLQRLTDSLARSEDQLKSILKLTAFFEKDATDLVNPSTMNGENTALLARLLDQRVLTNDKIAVIKEKIEGITRDVIVVPPMLPTEPTSPRRGMIAILSGLVAGFLTLLFVFVRLTTDNQGGEFANKAAMLKQAFFHSKKSA